MTHAQAAVHYCWVGGHRVKRLGSPLVCPQCRRYSNKHKCGMVRSSKDAWKPFPVDDCGSCMVSTTPSEGPTQGLERVKPVHNDPAASTRTPQVERHPGQKTKERWDKIRGASKRRAFLVLCLVVNGPLRAKDLYALVQRTYEVSSRRVYKDMQELVELRWVIAEQVKRENAPVWQSQTESRFTLNPQLREMCTL